MLFFMVLQLSFLLQSSDMSHTVVTIPSNVFTQDQMNLFIKKTEFDLKLHDSCFSFHPDTNYRLLLDHRAIDYKVQHSLLLMAIRYHQDPYDVYKNYLPTYDSFYGQENMNDDFIDEIVMMARMDRLKIAENDYYNNLKSIEASIRLLNDGFLPVSSEGKLCIVTLLCHWFDHQERAKHLLSLFHQRYQLHPGSYQKIEQLLHTAYQTKQK